MEGKKRALFSSVLLFLVKVKAPSRQACKPMQGVRLPTVSCQQNYLYLCQSFFRLFGL